MKQVILLGIAIFLMLALFLYLSQRHLIYHPSRKKPNLSDFSVENMRVVSLHTQDGLTLHSWYKPAKLNQPTLLYLHGNAGNIGDRMSLAQQLMERGFGLLLLEYRGYGGNKGRPTEQGLYADGRAGVRFLHQQGLKPSLLVLYGESLGTGVATKLAVEYKFCAVILQSGFTSMRDMARYYYPWIGLLKPWDRFDSIARIDAINAPLLIVHGTQDDVVPYSQGLQLFNQAREPKKMESFEFEGHNNIWNAPGFSEKVSNFIISHCNSYL